MNQQPHEPPGTDAAAAPVPDLDDDQRTVDHDQVAYRDAQPLLTPAMQVFAEHYATNHNQVKAYQFAYPGSSANAARANARLLFRDHRVQFEIQRVTERCIDHARSTLMQAEQVLSRLAHADVRRLYDTNGNLLPPHQWDPDTAAAVASYKETPTRDGGVIRTVRLHDKHAAARTLMEAKGAFDRNKAPPGVQAMFNINIGAGPITLGAPSAGRTINMDVAKPGKLAKARQLPAKAATKPIAKAKGKPLF